MVLSVLTIYRSEGNAIVLIRASFSNLVLAYERVLFGLGLLTPFHGFHYLRAKHFSMFGLRPYPMTLRTHVLHVHNVTELGIPLSTIC